MFYSTDPKSGGYVLTPEGTTVPRPAPDDDHDSRFSKFGTT